MSKIRAIVQRLKNGQSIRQIHEELKIHRTRVREVSRTATIHQWLDPDRPMPTDEEISIALGFEKKDKVHFLDPYQEKIKEWHIEGHSAPVILRLLTDEIPCDIQQIRRYCAKKFPTSIDPVMVRSTTPGKSADVDFGDLGFFLDSEGSVKKFWFFSLRLRHSRKAYREVVANQNEETFSMCHVRAFEHLGGVPEEVWLDCLKAGVIKSTVDNSHINRMYQLCAEHYGFVVCPCQPRTPEHKGGVENDVKYTKKNCLAYFRAKQKEMNIEIPKIQDFIEYLREWDQTIADVHIIQNVGRSPRDLFTSEEKVFLKPLPKNRWEPMRWKICGVRRDWRILFEGSFYSVPYQLIGEQVDVCATSSLVRIFHKNKEVTVHDKATKKFEYKRKPEHAPPFKEAVLQCSREGLLEMAQEMGNFVYELSHKILAQPTTDKLRPVRCLLGLTSIHSKERLNSACKRALECKLFSYASVKNILINNLDSASLEIKTKEVKPCEKVSRFERDLTSYKSSHKVPLSIEKTNIEDCGRKTYQELSEKIHPFSKNGNAMCGNIEMMIALDEMDEERKKQGLKTSWEILQEDYAHHDAIENAEKLRRFATEKVGGVLKQ